MKKYLLASAALTLGAAFAVPAAADINITATVLYDKDVSVLEILDKEKRVFLTTIVDVNGATAAESNAVNNQSISRSTATYNHVFGDGFFAERYRADFTADTLGSVNANFGITQYNQDVGYGANQANIVSAAVGRFAFFAEANNSASQCNGCFFELVEGRPRLVIAPNTVTETGEVTAGVARLIRSAHIGNSVNRNQGIVQMNQNAGIFNNQLNSASLAIAFNPSAVALAEADLGQFNTFGVTTETNVARDARIRSSVNFNTGVVMGNQAAGTMANQANLMSLSGGIAWPAGAAGTTAFLNSLPPLNF